MYVGSVYVCPLKLSLKVNRFLLNSLLWIYSKKRLRSIKKCNARRRRRIRRRTRRGRRRRRRTRRRRQWRTQEFCSRGVQRIQLRTEDREIGDLGAVAR
jgi:hypothetical protein